MVCFRTLTRLGDSEKQEMEYLLLNTGIRGARPALTYCGQHQVLCDDTRSLAA